MTDAVTLTEGGETKADWSAICCAEICIIASLNLNFPACLGCSTQGLCCCFVVEQQQVCREFVPHRRHRHQYLHPHPTVATATNTSTSTLATNATDALAPPLS